MLRSSSFFFPMPCRDFPTCFRSVDFFSEFTGLFPQQAACPGSARRPASLEEYFELCVRGAEFFLAPQLGICTARRCRGGGDHSSSSACPKASPEDKEQKAQRGQSDDDGRANEEQQTCASSLPSNDSLGCGGGCVGRSSCSEASGLPEREVDRKEGTRPFSASGSRTLEKQKGEEGKSVVEAEGSKKAMKVERVGSSPRSSCQSTDKQGEKPTPCDDSTLGRKWELAPYTFYAFPSQKKQAGVDTATLRWLLQNGLDFNQWIACGFDYFRLSELQMLEREKLKGGGAERPAPEALHQTEAQKQPWVECPGAEESAREASGGSGVGGSSEDAKENCGEVSLRLRQFSRLYLGRRRTLSLSFCRGPTIANAW